MSKRPERPKPPKFESDPPVLSDEDRQKINEWIHSKWTTLECERCGESDWVAMNHLVSGPTHAPNGFHGFGNKAYPMVMLACTNCANPRLLLSKPIGVSEGPLDDGQD